MTKKVFIIISRLNVGGPTKLVNSLHQELNQFGYSSTLISGHPIKGEGEILPNSNNENHLYIDGLSPGSGLFQTIFATYQMYRLLKKDKPNLIHTHQAKAGLLGRIAGFFARTPVRIHTFHGHVFNNYFSTFKTKIIITIEKLLAKITTKVIAISPIIEKEIIERYHITNKNKTIIQPIGIDTKPFITDESKGSTRRNLKLPVDKVIIGFASRLVPIKNPDLFISIAEILLEKNNHYHFLIVGDGPMQKAIQHRINASSNKKSFTLLPWQNELAQIYRSLDLLVLTSKNEGTPLAILESMFTGTPTASTVVGGVPDMIKDQETGVLLLGSAETMAAKISESLANQDLLKYIKKNGTQLVKDHYTIEHYLKNTADIYDQLIS